MCTTSIRAKPRLFMPDDRAAGALARGAHRPHRCEYFRDEEGRTRCCSSTTFSVHAGGSEVSTLLAYPSAVGYQPNLATEMASCRSITSTKKGSITSVQAVYVLPMTSPIPRRRRRLPP